MKRELHFILFFFDGRGCLSLLSTHSLSELEHIRTRTRLVAHGRTPPAAVHTLPPSQKHTMGGPARRARTAALCLCLCLVGTATAAGPPPGTPCRHDSENVRGWWEEGKGGDLGALKKKMKGRCGGAARALEKGNAPFNLHHSPRPPVSACRQARHEVTRALTLPPSPSLLPSPPPPPSKPSAARGGGPRPPLPPARPPCQSSAGSGGRATTSPS